MHTDVQPTAAEYDKMIRFAEADKVPLLPEADCSAPRQEIGVLQSLCAMKSHIGINPRQQAKIDNKPKKKHYKILRIIVRNRPEEKVSAPRRIKS